MPRWPLAVPAVLIVVVLLPRRLSLIGGTGGRVQNGGPGRPLSSSQRWRLLLKAPCGTPVCPSGSTMGVMTVGMMVVRDLVTVVASPADAWIRPAATKPRPARTTTHPAGGSASWRWWRTVVAPTTVAWRGSEFLHNPQV